MELTKGMDATYARYLLLVILVTAATATLGTLLYISTGGRKSGKKGAAVSGRTKKVGPQDVIDSGNVSVFFDRYRNAVLIPYVPDLFGSGKATADIIWLDMPYNADDLGRAVKSAMASCRNGKPADSATLMRLLRAPDWKGFSKGRPSISIYCRDRRNVMLHSTAKTQEGVYVYITKNPEICLPTDVSNAKLGESVLELLKRCR